MKQATEGQQKAWEQVFGRKLKRGESIHLTVGKNGMPLVINADDHEELHFSIQRQMELTDVDG